MGNFILCRTWNGLTKNLKNQHGHVEQTNENGLDKQNVKLDGIEPVNSNWKSIINIIF